MNTTTEPKTSVKKKPGAAAGWTTGQVISADGTVIGYRQFGGGPGLVMLHGGGRASQHYTRLAEALADGVTIYIPDRRGRGLSGPPGDNYSVQKELEDVSALVEKTGSPYLFGHSAGGFFALEAALKLPVEKLAVYEPAVSINGSLPLDWLPAFEQALDQNDSAKAFIIFVRGLRLNRVTELPDWFLYPLTKLMLRSEEGREMAELLPTLAWEIKAFENPGPDYHRYQNITAKTLLIGGAKSPDYLRYALRALAKTIPYSWFIELPKLDHNAPDENAPEVVASELRQFFL